MPRELALWGWRLSSGRGVHVRCGGDVACGAWGVELEQTGVFTPGFYKSVCFSMGCNQLSLRSRLNVSGYAALSTPSRLCAWKHVTNVVVLLEPPALVPVRRRVAQWRSRSG